MSRWVGEFPLLLIPKAAFTALMDVIGEPIRMIMMDTQSGHRVASLFSIISRVRLTESSI